MAELNKEGEVEWLAEFLPLHSKAATLVSAVARCTETNSDEATYGAFQKVVEEMPSILEQMKAIRNPQNKKLKQIKKDFEKAVKEYIDGCKYGIDYFDNPTNWSRSVWLVTANSATDKLEKATAKFKAFSERG